MELSDPIAALASAVKDCMGVAEAMPPIMHQAPVEQLNLIELLQNNFMLQ
ncbi:MAG: hypothetical protein ACBR11_03705 [Microcoleus sp.]